MSRSLLTTLAITLGALLALGPSRAEAQGAAPAKLSLVVMLKVLTYDKSFASRGQGDFVVAVSAEPGQEALTAEAMTATESLKGTAINGRPLKFVPVLLRRTTDGKFDSRAVLQGVRADAIVAVSGLSEDAVNSLGELAPSLKAYTLSLNPKFCDRQLALCVQNNGGKPQIVINQAAAQRLGAQFESSVLKLARVIQ